MLATRCRTATLPTPFPDHPDAGIWTQMEASYRQNRPVHDSTPILGKNSDQTIVASVSDSNGMTYIDSVSFNVDIPDPHCGVNSRSLALSGTNIKTFHNIRNTTFRDLLGVSTAAFMTTSCWDLSLAEHYHARSPLESPGLGRARKCTSTTATSKSTPPPAGPSFFFRLTDHATSRSPRAPRAPRSTVA